MRCLSWCDVPLLVAYLICYVDISPPLSHLVSSLHLLFARSASLLFDVSPTMLTDLKHIWTIIFDYYKCKQARGFGLTADVSRVVCEVV